MDTVRNATEVPARLREHAHEVRMVRLFRFDKAHLDVLDSQIRLSSQGPIWAARLKKRMDAMAPYCDKPLLKGRIEIDRDAYWIILDPQEGKVVYWEVYEDWQERML